MKRRIVCVLAVLLLPLSLLAQGEPDLPLQQREANTIHSTARLVVLDMVVVDAKGQPATGLIKRDEFHVTEAGEPQKILNFEVPGARTLSADISVNSTAELDRVAPQAPVNIILLDEFNTRFEDMSFARYSLKKYLTREESDHLLSPTMLVAVSLNSFKVLVDYTQSRAAILTALDQHLVAYPWQTQQNQWLGERYATAFDTLRRVALAVVGHPGHKNMIWIGRGFPPVNRSRTPIDTSNRLLNAVQDCVDTLRDARVTLYTVDPAGLMMDPSVYGGAAAFNDPFGGNYEFAALAKATGGRVFYGRNDVDTEIGTSIQDGSSFYRIVYRPSTESDNPQKFRKIVVTVDRPGLKVITREGYYPQGTPGRLNAEQPARRLTADLLMAGNSTMVYDGVPLTVRELDGEPENFQVHVDGRALNWSPVRGSKPRGLEVILMVSTFDRKGKELQHDANVLHIVAPSTDPPIGRLERPIDLPYKLAHDRKAVRVRFVVRVSSSGRIGTMDLPLGAAKP